MTDRTKFLRILKAACVVFAIIWSLFYTGAAYAQMQPNIFVWTNELRGAQFVISLIGAVILADPLNYLWWGDN